MNKLTKIIFNIHFWKQGHLDINYNYSHMAWLFKETYLLTKPVMPTMGRHKRLQWRTFLSFLPYLITSDKTSQYIGNKALAFVKPKLQEI